MAESKVDGVALIALERQRQIKGEGWTAEHDDDHGDGDLALAAVCYATPVPVFWKDEFAHCLVFRDPWPWDNSFDKRKTLADGNTTVPNRTLPKKERIRNLVKAGALIAAEIDRLQRL